MSYLVLDLETGCKEQYGRKGNPFINKIAAVGFVVQGEEVRAIDLRACSSDDTINGHLNDWLFNIKVLVGHNIKFDLLYLWKYEAFQKWLSSGGKIWDTQLAEYMLSGQTHKYPALRDIAVNKYECVEREKLMETYWDRGIDTFDIPIEFVLQDVLNDVLDTQHVLLQQVALSKKEDMYDLIREEMEGLLATTEMEYNGVYVNKEIFNNNKNNVIYQIDEITQELRVLVERHCK